MADKRVPFTRDQVEDITARFPTPFHLYDEAGMRQAAREFRDAFSWVPGGFRNYYAVKALPNPHVLKILWDEGMGFDCSSMAELILCEHMNVPGEAIMFTSNDTPANEYQKALELGAIINLDDITHIDYLNENVGMPELICFRYNPGPLRGGNAIIGKPEEAKYGLTREQLFEAYVKARDLGATRFALHTMVASNELNPDYFVDTAAMLFEIAVELKEKTGIEVEFVNLGGGIGIPYKPEQEAVDLAYVGKKIDEVYRRIIVPAGLGAMRIVMENGRCVTGPHGYLITRVLHQKQTYKNYVGLDGNMANLMRPGMYGAYHHITVLGKEDAPADHVYDVTGSLCENNDKFAIDRSLPNVEIGDLVAIHDTGAHGHSMGFNYNGKLRSAEILLHEDGSAEQIRRAETYEDYFATLDLSTVTPVSV
ncbi:MAG: diaminopimelate decarboxylase [Spirochaetaceae bacterium]|nr:MAG: diaminopimelate decarboxylase [Spirochaetaceae bacterium]